MRELSSRSFCLDGEIIALNEEGRPSFQLLQKRINLTDRSSIRELQKEISVHYFVFDLIACEGYDLRTVSLAERKKILAALLPQGTFVRCPSTARSQGRELFRLAQEKGLEGILAKNLTSTYKSQRSRQWLKIKCVRRQEFVIGGFTSPSGGRRHFGALLLGLFENGELTYVGRAGSGFDEADLEQIYELLRRIEQPQHPFKSIPKGLKAKSWVRPKLVCEVKFNEWTKDGYLRAPVFVGLKTDRKPEECRKEVAEQIDDSDPDLPYHFLSNLGKVFWPTQGHTKRDLIEFYHRIADVLVPYLADRPMVLERFPDGIEGESFYQKNAPEFLPDWIPRVQVGSDSGEKTIRYLLCNDRRTLVYLANLACISLHPWSSRTKSLDNPDFAVIDLDPSEGVAFPLVCKVARRVRQIVERLELRSYPKTSGASGMHIMIPLKPAYSYEDIRNFAEIIAHLTVKGLEEIATLERNPRKRKKRIYVDYLQNGKGKTIVSPYCLRPLPAAAVSTPLKWSEVNSRLRPESFNMTTVFRRLDRKGDLFQGMLKDRQSLRKALKKLEAVWEEC